MVAPREVIYSFKALYQSSVGDFEGVVGIWDLNYFIFLFKGAHWQGTHSPLSECHQFQARVFKLRIS